MKRYRVDVDEELMILVPKFLADRWNDTLKIRQCIEKCDFIALEEIGHLLQGTPGCFGYTFLVRAGRDLEAGAKRGDRRFLKARVHSIERFLNNHLIVEQMSTKLKTKRVPRTLDGKSQRAIGNLQKANQRESGKLRQSPST